MSLLKLSTRIRLQDQTSGRQLLEEQSSSAVLVIKTWGHTLKQTKGWQDEWPEFTLWDPLITHPLIFAHMHTTKKHNKTRKPNKQAKSLLKGPGYFLSGKGMWNNFKLTVSRRTLRGLMPTEHAHWQAFSQKGQGNHDSRKQASRCSNVSHLPQNTSSGARPRSAVLTSRPWFTRASIRNTGIQLMELLENSYLKKIV